VEVVFSYSVLKFLTGLANAAFMVWRIISKAVIEDRPIKAIRKGWLVSAIRYT